MDTTRKWHKGPPPHVGWWNASDCRNPRAWRWWNGKSWTGLTFAWEGASAAAYAATRREYRTEIEWTDYYPADARVPRINPEAK